MQNELYLDENRYLEPTPQTDPKLFATLVKDFQSLNIVTNSSIVDTVRLLDLLLSYNLPSLKFSFGFIPFCRILTDQFWNFQVVLSKNQINIILIHSFIHSSVSSEIFSCQQTRITEFHIYNSWKSILNNPTSFRLFFKPKFLSRFQ